MEHWKIPNELDKILKQHQGTIVTRFPPENSGYLHIGHVKALLINYVIAKTYNGQMILRFDDTNPKTESLEYENVITEDINTLNVIPNKVTHSSDYFSLLIEYAEFLIQHDKAYVDNTNKLIMKYERKNCIDSKNRNNTIDENVKLFNLMKNGNLKDSCVRIKFNMKHATANCRDPVIFRHIDTEHPTTKNKYKIYPTYDFACPIIDSIEGVTHAFRSVEYSDRSDQYNFILTQLNLRKPKLFCYGKVKFLDVVLSKRKIKALIDEGNINGWEDPRLFTLRGLLNRGICVDTLIQFAATLGFSSKTPPIMDTEKLWIMNKKIIDKRASRYFCLENVNLIKVNEVMDFSKEIPKYIKNMDLGMRSITYSDYIFICNDDYVNLQENEEISLMLWGNAIMKNNELILNLDGNMRSTNKKFLWVNKDDNVIVKINYIDKYKPIKSKYYVGESALLNLTKGDYVQFMKMNYYMCVDVDIDKKIVSFIEL